MKVFLHPCNPRIANVCPIKKQQDKHDKKDPLDDEVQSPNYLFIHLGIIIEIPVFDVTVVRRRLHVAWAIRFLRRAVLI